jgi:predicted CDP-diglyceride synthetase/phosphatidate cytidylyltransferase
MDKNIIFIIGLFLTVIIGIISILILRQFIRIVTIKENRESGSFLKEIYIAMKKYSKDMIFLDYFPISFFIRLMDNSNYNNLSKELKLEYDKKYKLEFIFWAIFLISILLIPFVSK